MIELATNISVSRRDTYICALPIIDWIRPCNRSWQGGTLGSVIQEDDCSRSSLKRAAGTTELSESNIAHPDCPVSLRSEQDVYSLASPENHLSSLVRLNIDKVIRNNRQLMVVDAEVQ